MNQFTYDSLKAYEAALAKVQRLGVDYLEDRETLTLITDELTHKEYQSLQDPIQPN